MTDFTPISASISGALIGASAVLLMASLGRIAGISGIAGGLATAQPSDRSWRVAFLIGLIGAPALMVLTRPELLRVEFTVSLPLIALAGVIVGVGTTLGNGCTSGHGVCGNARLSGRSIVATLTFMATGIATTLVMRHVIGGV
jgi:uncharacterized membrane protein YedE/YeeE